MPTLNLTDTECKIVLAGLAELPLKISFPVARAIELQLVKPPEAPKDE